MLMQDLPLNEYWSLNKGFNAPFEVIYLSIRGKNALEFFQSSTLPCPVDYILHSYFSYSKDPRLFPQVILPMFSYLHYKKASPQFFLKESDVRHYIYFISFNGHTILMV